MELSEDDIETMVGSKGIYVSTNCAVCGIQALDA